MTFASIPSPAQGVWYVGPFPLRAYALCILLGAVTAVWLGRRRWRARGGDPDDIYDVAAWAVPFGLIGARLYHVATNPELYFAAGKNPITALYIWNGGIGIWGAVAAGALGAYISCRRHHIDFRSLADAVAPGILIAQAIGRFGDYFNQELFGRPTELPWALRIGLENRPPGFSQFDTFHPTFLYESVWNLLAALTLIAVDRRLKLDRGRAFVLYVALYTAGRTWIEALRIDDAHLIGPFRLNVWTAIVVFMAAVVYLVRTRPGRRPTDARDGPDTGVREDESPPSAEEPLP